MIWLLPVAHQTKTTAIHDHFLSHHWCQRHSRPFPVARRALSPSRPTYPVTVPHLVQIVQKGLMDLLIRLQVTGRRGFVAQQHPLRHPVGGWMGPQRAVVSWGWSLWRKSMEIMMNIVWKSMEIIWRSVEIGWNFWITRTSKIILVW